MLDRREAVGRRVLFDLDGTLTRVDTLPFYLLWTTAHRPWRFPLFLRVLGPVASYCSGHGSASVAKEALIAVAVAGLTTSKLERITASFVRWILPWLMRPVLMERLRKHLVAGDEVWLVSAAMEPVCTACAGQWGLTGAVGTRLEAHRDKLTGRFQGANCVGEEKVKRLAASLGATNTSADLEIWMAYGDNPERDGPMLRLAQVPVHVPGELPALEDSTMTASVNRSNHGGRR